MLEPHRLQLLLSRLDPIERCLVQRQVAALPGVQEVQPVLHLCRVEALFPQLHLLELVSAWSGERRRNEGSPAAHAPIPTVPVLLQTQPSAPTPPNHQRNSEGTLWGRGAPWGRRVHLNPTTDWSPNQVSPPSSVSILSVRAVTYLSWRLHAGTAGRRAVHRAAGPFSAHWQRLLGYRSSLGQQWLPFLPSLQSLRGREGKALRHAVPVVSSPSAQCQQVLLHRPCSVPKQWHVRPCHQLCHHPVAKATSDTLRSWSPPPREGTCSLFSKDTGSSQMRQIQDRTWEREGTPWFLLSRCPVASSQLAHGKPWSSLLQKDVLIWTCRTRSHSSTGCPPASPMARLP